jgi:hypothetical protein
MRSVDRYELIVYLLTKQAVCLIKLLTGRKLFNLTGDETVAEIIERFSNGRMNGPCW